MCSLAARSDLLDLRCTHFRWVQSYRNRRKPKLAFEAYRRNSAVEEAVKQHYELNLPNKVAARALMPKRGAYEQPMGMLTSNCSEKAQSGSRAHSYSAILFLMGPLTQMHCMSCCAMKVGCVLKTDEWLRTGLLTDSNTTPAFDHQTYQLTRVVCSANCTCTPCPKIRYTTALEVFAHCCAHMGCSLTAQKA